MRLWWAPVRDQDGGMIDILILSAVTRMHVQVSFISNNCLSFDSPKNVFVLQLKQLQHDLPCALCLN